MKGRNIFIAKILQGTLIGIGAVLPGISGGVLCVIFGIYKPVMELMANPFGRFKSHVPKLFPVLVGVLAGFLGIANVLSFLLEKYPAQSVCVFVGLIFGMLPALYKEAGEHGRSKASYISMGISALVVFILLAYLQILSLEIIPNNFWYLFCGVCMALSIIAPGLSFSTLLMPLGLYEPFVAGIGHLDFGVIIPAGIGALSAVILFSKGLDSLFTNHYSVAFHGIVGIVMAATSMIIPFEAFVESTTSFITNIICIIVGIIVAIALENFNKRFEVAKEL